MQFVGLDVHRDFIYATVVDSKGCKLMEKKFSNTIPDLHSFVSGIDKAKIAMEACYSWQHVYDFLEDSGFDVTLAHPLKTRLIAESRIKTDKIDSGILANLLRVNMVARSYVPPKKTRQERRITRHRASLVKIRTQVKNSIHAILARNGIKHEFSDLFGKSGIEFLRTISLDDESRFELNQYLVILRVLNHKIDENEDLIKDLAQENYYAKLLISIPGISYYSALLIASEIADIRRFGSAKHLCSYAGLVPSTYQTGNSIKHGGITKQGSKWIRWIMVQAANKAINSNSRLKELYSRIAKRKGHNVAITAVARKMLCYAYVMLKEGIKFDALRVNRV